MLPPFFFSNPVDVFEQIVKLLPTRVIWKHIWITLVESILAFAIGSIGGVLVGFWFARQPLVAAVFDPYVKMVNALPRVVLAPIFALWLGLGIWSKVALGVTLVFFIVFFNVYQGVKEVSRTVLDNGRMLGMSEGQLMRHVYWPSALSWMFSSLHTSVGFAVVGAVVGEYLGSAAGLGYLIQQAEGVFDVAGVFAGMFVLSAFVILIDYGVTLVERRLLMWRPTVAGRGYVPEGSRLSASPEANAQSSSLVSSGACGGVLIAIALTCPLIGFVPPCGVPFGMMTRSPGFTVTSLSPSHIVPVPSRMYWISLVLGCMCFGTLPTWIEIVAPSAVMNVLERKPTLLASPSASPSISPVWMICGAMLSAANAGRSKWVAPHPAAKAVAIDSPIARRFMDSSPIKNCSCLAMLLRRKANGQCHLSGASQASPAALWCRQPNGGNQ